jgi:hypothetical protein
VLANPQLIPGFEGFAESQLKDASWFDLTSRERDALLRYAESTGNTKLAAALAESEDRSRWQGSVFQAARDQVASYWDGKATSMDEMLRGLRTAALDPEQVRDAISRMRTEAAAPYASADYKDAVSKLPADDLQKLLDVWHGMYENPAYQKNGLPDYEAIDAARAKLMEGVQRVDPALANRLQFNVERGPDAADHQLLRLYDASMKLLAPYWELPAGDARTKAREAVPKLDAHYALWYGNPPKLRTVAGVDEYWRLAHGHTLSSLIISGAVSEDEARAIYKALLVKQ